MYRRYLSNGPQLPSFEAVTDTSAGAGGSPSPSGTGTGGSPTSTTSPSTGSSPAGAAVQPGTGGSPAAVNRDPIPFDRFEEVNSRLGKVAWAESLEKDRVEQATRLFDWFDDDPEGAYEYLTGLMRRNNKLPATQPQAHGTTHAQPNYPIEPSTGRPAPDIEIKETGMKFYSAEQAARLADWTMSKIDERLKPLEAASTTAQARGEAQQVIAEAEASWPHFKEHIEDIFKELNKDKRLSLEGAYRRVVLPKIKQLERDTVLKELKTRGTATTTNPASGATASTEDLSKLSIPELFKREMRKRGYNG